MVNRPPRIPRDSLIRNTQYVAPNLPQNRILRGHQHLVTDLTTGTPLEGNQIDVPGHLSSNTKIATLAFIVRLRSGPGDTYLQDPATLRRLRTMMSVSHNDATILEAARAMATAPTGVPPDIQQRTQRFLNLVSGEYRPLQVNGGRIDRLNDNNISNAYPAETRAFFQDYDRVLNQYRSELGIQDASIHDTSGRSRVSMFGSDSPYGMQLPHSSSAGSPRNIANLVRFLYNYDNGQLLRHVSNPAEGPHTTSGYLSGRNRPGNGQVFFAKTGTLTRDELNDSLPPNHPAHRQFPNGVHILTIGYMQDGQPRLVTFRADSDAQRQQLARRFLDDVAGLRPGQRTDNRAQERRTELANATPTSSRERPARRPTSNA